MSLSFLFLYCDQWVLLTYDVYLIYCSHFLVLCYTVTEVGTELYCSYILVLYCTVYIGIVFYWSHSKVSCCFVLSDWFYIVVLRCSIPWSWYLVGEELYYVYHFAPTNTIKRAKKNSVIITFIKASYVFGFFWRWI